MTHRCLRTLSTRSSVLKYIMEQNTDKASQRPSSSPAPFTAPPSRHHTLVLHSPYSLQTLRVYAFLAQSARTLVLPNSSPEDADMFRILERVDITYLLRRSRGNSSAQAVRAHNSQRRSASLLDALMDAVCVSISIRWRSPSLVTPHPPPSPPY
ncbi:hypothetical protein B0H13DRAFT_796389 [Mycena leptocephala]|nr:hypothetical protein B0H13DRAFT_796389 [Mycena leptocephala]